jgi:hypothetical protein
MAFLRTSGIARTFSLRGRWLGVVATASSGSSDNGRGEENDAAILVLGEVPPVEPPYARWPGRNLSLSLYVSLLC